MAEPAPGRRLLLETAELVEAGWCCGAEARAADGTAVDPWDPEARSWSLLGALVAALEREAALREELPLDQLAGALTALAEFVDEDWLAYWNDAPQRSQQVVVETLHAAALACDERWIDARAPSLN